MKMPMTLGFIGIAWRGISFDQFLIMVLGYF
jgi:hypothetical protein